MQLITWNFIIIDTVNISCYNYLFSTEETNIRKENKKKDAAKKEAQSKQKLLDFNQ